MKLDFWLQRGGVDARTTSRWKLLLLYHDKTWLFCFAQRPRSVVLQLQKLKTHLFRTQSSEVLPSKPGIGRYKPCMVRLFPTISFTWLISGLPVHPPAFSPQNLSRVFPLFVVANTGSCVGPQNKIGHPARRYTQLSHVHMLGFRGI